MCNALNDITVILLNLPYFPLRAAGGLGAAADAGAEDAEAEPAEVQDGVGQGPAADHGAHRAAQGAGAEGQEGAS